MAATHDQDAAAGLPLPRADHPASLYPARRARPGRLVHAPPGRPPRGRPHRPLHPRPEQGRPDRRPHRPGLRRHRARPRPHQRLDRAARRHQPRGPRPARPTPPSSLRHPAARPRPQQPAAGRSHLQGAAPGRVLRPGHRRHRLCPVDLHPGVRRPGAPRAGTDPQTSDEFVRRLHGFFAALPPGEFPHTVRLAPCWPGSPPATSSSPASRSSSPASKPSSHNAGASEPGQIGSRRCARLGRRQSVSVTASP